jgi:hypothetical protein
MEYLSSINDNKTQKKAQLHQFFGEHSEFPTLMNTVKTLQCAAKVAMEYRCAAAAAASNNTMNLSQSPMHRRTHSTPPIVAPRGGGVGGGYFLSIDDPIEDDSYEGWYSGRRSPSPPPPPSAGDTHRRIASDGRIGLPDFPASITPSFHTEHSPLRSAIDSSLFRLIVTLQLCLVRLEEANSILCYGQAEAESGVSAKNYSQSMCLVSRNMVAVGVTIGGAFVLASRSKRANQGQYDVLQLAGRASAGVATASLIRRRWRILCMNARIANSAVVTEEWIMQWICLIHNNGTQIDAGHKQFVSPKKVSLTIFLLHVFDSLQSSMFLLLLSYGISLFSGTPAVLLDSN